MKLIKAIILFAATVVCNLLAGCTGAEGRLECNTGIADITPEGSVALAGFAARKGLSDGVHRRLNSHCLIIRKDTVRVCVITNDMMEIDMSFAEELRREISSRTGIPYSHIFIHNTHTHSAPRTGGWSVEAGGPNADYKKRFAETVVANAVGTAADKKGFRAFTIEAGRGICDINCNRRESDGPIDHALYAVRFIDKKDMPIVSLINFACHPVSLNHKSLVVSTDFPGIAVEELEKKWNCPVFYFSGAAGNVDPCGALRADTAYTRQLGIKLASAAYGIEFRALPRRDILRVATEEIRLPYLIPEITAKAIDAHADSLLKQTGVSASWPVDVEGWRTIIQERIAAGEVKSYLPFAVAAVNAGGVLMLFSQGEPFNEYQTALRESQPGEDILFIAYTNGQNSYLPSDHAFNSGTGAYAYEKDQMHVYIKAPYPLSDTIPAVYEAAIEEIIEKVK